MHQGFVNALNLRCPAHHSTSASKISFVSNDLTPLLFDNDYFLNTMRGRGVLNIDAALPLDSRTRPFVLKFATDHNAFYSAFSSAFLKLSSSNVLTGNQGVIRRSCNRFHWYFIYTNHPSVILFTWCNIISYIRISFYINQLTLNGRVKYFSFGPIILLGLKAFKKKPHFS